MSLPYWLVFDAVIIKDFSIDTLPERHKSEVPSLTAPISWLHYALDCLFLINQNRGPLSDGRPRDRIVLPQ